MAGTLTRRNFLSLDFGDRRAAGDHWVRVHRVAMACRFEVMLSSDDAIDVEAARAALDEADEVESMLAVARETGEVVELNRHAAVAPAVVSTDFFALLERCAELHASTDGAFDVAPADAGMRQVTLDRERRTVSFARPGVELSFGAISKGYALDRMAGVLRGHGARRALLSAGRSSVLAIGGRGRGWPIDVKPRHANQPAGRLWIRDGAVGTSAGGTLAVSVVARDAASADALSTAFLIGGEALARAYCEVRPDTMAIVVVDGTGETARVFGRYDGATLEKLT